MGIINRVVGVGIVIAAVVAAGCSAGKETVINRTIHPDGTVEETETDSETYLEGERQKTIRSAFEFGEEMAKRPDADGHVSEGGEISHTWFKNSLGENVAKTVNAIGSGKFDLEIVRTQQRHQTARSFGWMIAPPLVNAAINGTGPAGRGGTEINESYTFTDSTVSASGGPVAGSGAPGGTAEGGAGAPASGGSRGIQIGGIGNAQNSEDVRTGFMNRWNDILEGQGVIGKQGQSAGRDTGNVEDRDEGRVGLSPEIF